MRVMFMPSTTFARRTVTLLGCCLWASLLVVAPVETMAQDQEAPHAAPDAVSVVWAPKDLRFHFDNYDSDYSCNGLRDRLRGLLLALGAQKDLKFDTKQCSNAASSSVFVGPNMGSVRVPGGGTEDLLLPISMHVLKVSDALHPDSEGVLAHWKSIDLTDKNGPLDPNDCTLAKQVVDAILPLFVTRNVEFNPPRCNRVGNGPAVHLRLEVLVVD